MKRKLSKVLAIVVVFALAMSFVAVTAFAIDGTTTNTFQKHLVVGEDNEVLPDVTFTFSVAAGTAVAGTSTTLEIFPGPMNPAPTVTQQAVFTSASTLNEGLPTDAPDGTPTSGSQYATENVIVNFANVSFPAPGVYRYVITENASTAPGVTIDQTPRYLDVIVLKDTEDADGDEDTEELLIGSYVMRDQAENIDLDGDYVADPTTPGAKSSSFTNTYDTVDLEFSKAVTGNQGDKNKQFKFTLNITDANPGVYAVEVNRADVVVTDSTSEDYSNVAVGAETNTYTITVAANGTCTAYFYLADGDTVKVLDLPEGYGYTLTEDPEDYTSTATLTGYMDPTTGSAVDADVKTGFTNDRNGIIPTGVILTIAPFAIGILVFGAIILYTVNRRRRAEY